ncbi:MAG: ATP-binding cassette domain-containing protein, partial [Candidatus Borkfalkiaceae bacterium]|nr:ATP-binding cassette domain-containing protein [Christensenellaceae bacterium]
MEREVKLSVKNLKISFRTDAGKVQAVRDISFDLYKGETLAIVGESGSGKSVTNRAVMGILAGNAIKEGGEIIYDGQDLMKIPEEAFHKIRGDKIAMIFQDPMSSLNPIMRVGKQLTEAMLIKGKISQKSSRKDFNSMLALINERMDATHGNDALIKAENKKLCSDFDKFEYKHLELQQAYNRAKEALNDSLPEIDDVLFRIEKNAFKGVRRDTEEIVRVAKDSCHKYVVRDRAEELKSLLSALKKQVKPSFVERAAGFFKRLFNQGDYQEAKQTDYSSVALNLRTVREILAEAEKFTMPNFFAMGYYLTFAQQPLPEMPVNEINVFLRKYLDDNFMLGFIEKLKKGVKYSAEKSAEKKRATTELIEKLTPVFAAERPDKKQIFAAIKQLSAAVIDSIDRLDIIKDNTLYTFPSGITAAANLYFDGIIRNKNEEIRYKKQKSKYDAAAAKGKTPDWKVADTNLVNLAEAQKEMLDVLGRVKEKLLADANGVDGVNLDERAVALIDYLKEKASNVVYKVTRRMAKTRALKLLDEVGIPEPRKRYKQYPFEFSGGMRQRIVIAIALSANPDILICDEPTTALDVTIQSQILELINKVKQERKLSVIFITHDLGVVANMADRVAVMYAGKIVEIGTANDVFYSPAHPYTWALLS